MQTKWKKKSRRKSQGSIWQFLLVFVLVFMSAAQMNVQAAKKTDRKSNTKTQQQTATLRIISTTDLHGQVTTTHYDNASEKTGSLAQIYTLIKQARQEVGTQNSMTFDTGDSVYGYAADYILEHTGEEAVQPIYKAMALINYDAITLGNHDFDYGYPYIDKQLELSGLKNKCVLSNIIRTDTGETAWNETKFLTRKVRTDKNKSVNVNIGVIGVTIPSMSSYSNCREDLMALPIVSTVKKQAAALKAQGVDLVIVIAHSSFGSVNPESMSDNAVYALTQLKDVDAIVAGHGHKNYPSSDQASAAYYRLPNVDKQTGLMNGKPVTMIKDHGAGIGLIDLKLNINADGEVSLQDSSASLRMVTKDTPSSASIVEAQQPEIAPVDASLTNVIGTLDTQEKINSYFALLEDNYAIQLANESKLQYGLSYTGGAGRSLYADYPVVATTKYTLSNSYSATDNISLNGSITMKDILNMQQDNHNNNIIYWVTGGQLRELIEWSASVYATADGTVSSDQALQQLLAQHGASSIASSDWLDDWSAFAVFDGIEYTIDATRQPRYEKSGEILNPDAHRVVSMTHNGQPVADDQRLILVSHTIPGSLDATGSISSQKIVGKTDLAYQHLISYIKQQQELGQLTPDTDHNWKVVFDSARSYVVRSSVLSQQDAAMKQWFNSLLSTNETFAYYLAQFIQAEETADQDGPLLIVSETLEAETDKPVDIKVQANDRSGIAQLKWTAGKEAADSSVWDAAQVVTRGCFCAEANGMYTVMAEDIFGNRVVKYVNVQNINPDAVQAPALNKISNKGSVVSGTARYGTVVHIDADGSTYEAEVSEDGTFTCTVQRMAAGKTVSAYCTDENGKMSKTVSVTVFKNGPDVPVINEFSNKSLSVSGHFTDNASAVVAIIGKDVYCAAADKALYERSELYSKSRVLQTVSCTTSRNNFELSLPVQNARQEVKFVAIDKAGRKSATVSAQTQDAAPNVPYVQQICDVEDYLYGQVTNVNQSGTVTVTVGNRAYTGEIQADGRFAVQTDGCPAGQIISVVANDVREGTERSSLAATVTVQPYADFVTNADTRMQTTYTNSLSISGDTLPYYDVNVVVRGKSTRVVLDSNGQFTCPLASPLAAGEKIYVVARNQGMIAEVTEQTVTEYAPAVVTPAPETPSVLTSEITLNTAQIEVLAKEPGTIVMNIDGIEYTSQAGIYNQSYNGYVYTMQLPQAAAEQTITIRFVNASGISSNTITVMRTNNA